MVASTLVTRKPANITPIDIVAEKDFEKWLKAQTGAARGWLKNIDFQAAPGAKTLLPNGEGATRGLFILPTDRGPWPWSDLAQAMAPGAYELIEPFGRRNLAKPETAYSAALGWALAAYHFGRYKKSTVKPRNLFWPQSADRKAVIAALDATSLVRDLINTPAGDLGPSELATEARTLARKHGAKAKLVIGDQLLKMNYPAIHAVGRAATDEPRFIDLTWGKPGAPKITLVGKGVCFDSGGLDLKSAAGMRYMKKDMGGAAHVLGLASMIMAANLPVRLRVLIAAVENAVAGNAFRPGDIVTTRKGIRVEVGNTDAEGRLVLSDCLAEAASEKPEMILDFATLTGAARVALGAELPAMFANDDRLAADILAAGERTADPVWRLPLHQPYRSQLQSKIADLNNISPGGFGGAITAALFLEAFIEPGIPWVHFDLMAWNQASRPGRPEGGEAMAMRAVHDMLETRYILKTPKKKK